MQGFLAILLGDFVGRFCFSQKSRNIYSHLFGSTLLGGSLANNGVGSSNKKEHIGLN